MTSVAIVHDYLTQRGGAERVVLALAKAFPGAPVHTSLYDPEGTFFEFREIDVKPTTLNAIGALRRHHRWALPFLARTFSRMQVQADVVLCSSSGWAHGAQAIGRKVVYCYSPARWLYQPDRYLSQREFLTRGALSLMAAPLRRWDRRAAATADRYLTLSTSVADRIRDVYGIEAEILPPPYALDPDGPREPVSAVEPGYFLCVSRLLPYKNVDAVIEAFRNLDYRLVIVGAGPMEARLRARAPRNVRVLGRLEDPRLRWLYANAHAIIAASYEDYGLTPLEGAAFGKPAVVLRWGGFLDTTVEGVSGTFFDEPEPRDIAGAVERLVATDWSESALRQHADRYSESAFISRLREIVDEEATEVVTDR